LTDMHEVVPPAFADPSSAFHDNVVPHFISVHKSRSIMKKNVEKLRMWMDVPCGLDCTRGSKSWLGAPWTRLVMIRQKASEMDERKI